MAKEFKSVKTTSFIAEGTELVGKLTIKGGIRIDGRVKGDIFSESVVFLGDSAKVDANIQAMTRLLIIGLRGPQSSDWMWKISPRYSTFVLMP